jgi:ADP-ribose pyrophosphatase YjhB (NUDIX family)
MIENMTETENNYCNNCGKYGHLFHQCKVPITSYGVITFRVNNGEIEYLMIRRKDTLGYIDFMRGKYSIYNKYYILNMLMQMTIEEKEYLKTSSFHDLWERLWGNNSISTQYKNEEIGSNEKFHLLKLGILTKNDFYTLDDLIEESYQYEQWTEAEWGFPKGRRNYQEKDYDCAVREFTEETGYDVSKLKNVHNILPFDEIFTGSNYKSYKHKYYLMYMTMENSMVEHKYDTSEISQIQWKTLDQCLYCIRSYNLEKKGLIQKIHNSLIKYNMYLN